jgi:hypothetical protein
VINMHFQQDLKDEVESLGENYEYSSTGCCTSPADQCKSLSQLTGFTKKRQLQSFRHCEYRNPRMVIDQKV